jgi:type VI protein secretion system component Hcp
MVRERLFTNRNTAMDGKKIHGRKTTELSDTDLDKVSGGTIPYNAPTQTSDGNSTAGHRTLGNISVDTEVDQATPHLIDALVDQPKKQKR